MGAAVVLMPTAAIEFAEFAAGFSNAIDREIFMAVNLIGFAVFAKINVINGEFAQGGAGLDECIIRIDISLTFPCRIARSGT
ncbi:hypothetical protein [Mycobacterium aquaticum]|uniref:Uncharacterized protein n=1 Tax=Mycobacterium aquaticum TaxID=1927124 RepID=A0A1X0A7Y8_9MYCO|nr:hypothetical protein [Mycobacterium aquaticum]ORA25998.1 hypothetical protein BST13_32260 [Mycobacterium aquaticum]